MKSHLRQLAVVAFLTALVVQGAPDIYFGEDLSPYPYPAPNDVPRPANIPNTLRAATAFASRLPGILGETFEGLPTSSKPATVVFGTNAAALAGDYEIFTVLDPASTFGGLFPISGTNVLLLKAEQAGFFSLEFSSPQGAFGFYGTDFGEPTGMWLRVITASGTTNTVSVPITRPQGSGGSFFFGIIEQTNPFVRIEFHPTGTEFDWFGFDNMTIATPDQVHSAPAVLDIALAPSAGPTAGIGLSGTVGATYRLEYVTELPQTNWTALTNITLPTPRFLFIDGDPTTNHAKRFYRAVTVE
jgi:hypothetical protein